MKLDYINGGSNSRRILEAFEIVQSPIRIDYHDRPDVSLIR